MRNYTAITLDREVLRRLEEVKREVGTSSLGDTINYLILFWRSVKADMFVKEIDELRRDIDKKIIKDAIHEIRGLKW